MTNKNLNNLITDVSFLSLKDLKFLDGEIKKMIDKKIKENAEKKLKLIIEDDSWLKNVADAMIEMGKNVDSSLYPQIANRVPDCYKKIKEINWSNDGLCVFTNSPSITAGVIAGYKTSISLRNRNLKMDLSKVYKSLRHEFFWRSKSGEWEAFAACSCQSAQDLLGHEMICKHAGALALKASECVLSKTEKQELEKIINNVVTHSNKKAL